MDQQKYLPPQPTYWNKSSVENMASAIAAKLDFSIGDPIEPIVSRLGFVAQIG
ncbi:hypothetical protein [Roseovarius amoyensis]|uniref:hypothetical protein n=1 Tax=Roseovarius amoyensis TaxID=2211448 RepID=UPI0013A70640|nr:hypothetical protein [Roseovarius amoyensis]